jgi:hypothetical protein
MMDLNDGNGMVSPVSFMPADGTLDDPPPTPILPSFVRIGPLTANIRYGQTSSQ